MAPKTFQGRLIPQVVDKLAQERPDGEFMSVSRTQSAKDGWKPITFSQFATAVDRVANKLISIRESTFASKINIRNGMVVEPTSEEHSASFPTVAYIGPNDLRYPIAMVACIKAGMKALFISPRNSLEGQLNLFEKTACDLVFYDKSFEDDVKPWLEARPSLKAIPTSTAEGYARGLQQHRQYMLSEQRAAVLVHHQAVARHGTRM